ncbi:type II secretion system F family protein [Aeromicrobium sp. IC_218]|uniref:type II secretion system F family protein n=1 Tax=Aeromicrobium sp. IC_218 TaxID=2545468 RepID=UPI00103AF5E1|nr:type II secretion system F family protein [Aeromicrobium sp. IC_218]TCI96864.1 type II secretion system protein [Aeromicrobium sp. IC_218]
MIPALLLGLAAALSWPPTARRRWARLARPDDLGWRASVDPVLVARLLAAVGALVLLGTPWGLLAAPVAALVAGRMVHRLEPAAVRRRAEAVRRTLPDALDLLAAAMRAGHPAEVALASVAASVGPPLADELGVASSRLAVGVEPSAVWQRLRQEPGLDGLGRAFALAERSGMPVARLLERAADDARRERSAAAAGVARAVGVRTAAPLGLCFLPAFFLVGVAPTVIGALSGLLP